MVFQQFLPQEIKSGSAQHFTAVANSTKYSPLPHPTLLNMRALKIDFNCQICGFGLTADESPPKTYSVRGNTERTCQFNYSIWECPRCHSILNSDPVDFKELYLDYPLNHRPYDLFARLTLKHLLRRLKKHGLRHDHSILDYGCGNGLFLRLLKANHYTSCAGYDPFVSEFSSPGPLAQKYDWIIANDVIEHVSNPKSFLKSLRCLLKPGGRIYLGTCCSDGLSFAQLENERMRLHQPYHRALIPQQVMADFLIKNGFTILTNFRRSYMDTLIPFANYRFLDELSRATRHNMEKMLGPEGVSLTYKSPRILFFGLFGYFFPTAYEPAWILEDKITSPPSSGPA